MPNEIVEKLPTFAHRAVNQCKYQGQKKLNSGDGHGPLQTHRYQPRDLDYDAEHETCICPAGKKLYGNGSDCTINGYAAVKFQGALCAVGNEDGGNTTALMCSHRKPS